MTSAELKCAGWDRVLAAAGAARAAAVELQAVPDDRRHGSKITPTGGLVPDTHPAALIYVGAVARAAGVAAAASAVDQVAT